MSTSPKVLVLFLITPRFEAYNPNSYEDNEPVTAVDARDGRMFKLAQVLRVNQRSCSCGGYALTKSKTVQIVTKKSTQMRTTWEEPVLMMP